MEDPTDGAVSQQEEPPEATLHRGKRLKKLFALLAGNSVSWFAWGVAMNGPSAHRTAARFLTPCTRCAACCCCPQVQQPMLDFRKRAYLVALCACAAQLVAFVIVYIILMEKETLIFEDLLTVTHAGHASYHTVSYMMVLLLLYSNRTMPGMRLMQSRKDIPYVRQVSQVPRPCRVRTVGRQAVQSAVLGTGSRNSAPPALPHGHSCCTRTCWT